VTKNADMIKVVIIYDRSISNFLRMQLWEYDALQITNFSFITVKLKGVSPLPLPVYIPFIFIAKTGKLSHTFIIIPLRTPFDRGHVYCWSDDL